MRIAVENYQQQTVYGTDYVASTPTTSSLAPNIVPPPSEPAPADQNVAEGPPASTSDSRCCSVRGCSKPLAPDSNNKMCEVCRGRHRIYANTKRAKRKMEKAAIISQNMVHVPPEQRPAIWIAETSIQTQEAGQDNPAYNAGPSEASANATPQMPIYVSTSPARGWDYDPALDPRLFMPRSSELAGALTLPVPGSQAAGPSTMPNSSIAGSGDVDTQSAELSQMADTDRSSEAPSASSSTAFANSSSTPPRYCSVKGCKAIIPGDYFYKMCEPCRNRYRGYGITKRAKWKQSRSAANAELDVLREEEDKRRVELGFKLLAECPEEYEEWERKTIEHIDGGLPSQAEDELTEAPALPARMCTVSHCHKILSGQYKYRRCEQHRLQNRYHSRLKRVREKETKSHGPPGSQGEDPPSDDDEPQPKKPRTLEPLFTNAPIDVVRGTRDEDFDGEDGMQFLMSMAGIPPAARGIRRTNHTCSVKQCFNLLAPHVPWKMCDTCRAHDRTIRNTKRLRDIGKLPPLPPRDPSDPDNTKRRRAPRRRRGQVKEVSEVPSNTDEDDIPAANGDNGEASGSGTAGNVNEESTQLEMDAIQSARASPVPINEQNSPSAPEQAVQPPAPAESGVSAVVAAPVQSTSNGVTSSEVAVVSNDIVIPTAPPVVPIRRRRRKVVQPVPATAAGGSEAPGATTAGAAPPTGPSAPTSTQSGPPEVHADAHPYPLQPQYQVPWYMHHPYPPFVPSQQAYASSHELPPPQGYPHPPYPTQPYGSYTSYPYGPYPPQQQFPFPPRSFMPPPFGATPYPQYAPPPIYAGQLPQGFMPPPQAPPIPREAQPPPQAQATVTDTTTRQNGESSNGKNAEAGNTETPSTPDPTATGRAEAEASGTQGDSDGENVVPAAVVPNGDNTTTDGVNNPSTSVVRQCAHKSCHRTLPSSFTGGLCDRCRARIRKHSKKTKLRFRLEPRRSIVTTV